jgi:hypothetical protein
VKYSDVFSRLDLSSISIPGIGRVSDIGRKSAEGQNFGEVFAICRSIIVPVMATKRMLLQIVKMNVAWGVAHRS